MKEYIRGREGKGDLEGGREDEVKKGGREGKKEGERKG